MGKASCGGGTRVLEVSPTRQLLAYVEPHPEALSYT
jgi:hypothetical protein